MCIVVASRGLACKWGIGLVDKVASLLGWTLFPRLDRLLVMHVHPDDVSRAYVARWTHFSAFTCERNLTSRLVKAIHLESALCQI